MRNTSMNQHLRLVAALALAFSSTVFAQAPKVKSNAKPNVQSEKADDKVDISDLENKYWAPKDTDFSVVQNRTYSKDHRLFLTLQYGMPINDAYSTGSLMGLTANYFLSERYGLQLNVLSADLKNNQSTDDLVNFGGSGVQPDHGRMKAYAGLGFNFVPFYAKMSFLGNKILYFDMAVTPTVGMTQYEQIMRDSTPTKNALTYGVDLTQFFFLNNWFAIRLDLKNQWYSQDVVKYYNSGGARQGDPVNSRQIHDSIFLMGATFYW